MASVDRTTSRDVPLAGVPVKLATNGSHDRVIQAALHLFARRGFHGTGIRDLAAEAGLSTSSLYHYMGTKEDLLFQIMDDCLRRLLVAARHISQRSEPVDRIAGLISMHVGSHALQREASLVVDNEINSLETNQRLLAIAQRDEYEAIWKAAIADGVAAGDFSVANESFARFALLEMCSGVARWYTQEGALPLRQIAEEHVELGLALLGSTSGDRRNAQLDEIAELFESVWQISIS